MMQESSNAELQAKPENSAVDYLDQLTEMVRRRAPLAIVKAPFPVLGQPGMIGVIVYFPDAALDKGKKTNFQKISFALEQDDLTDAAALAKRAALACDCYDFRVVSLFNKGAPPEWPDKGG